ncbi:uncharacterized protein CTRU02_215746 [Colletotrichum truncatum]|uniref:Uncharacterized protein n=1 Tax=Colletotrichum truncatum TaxID=5467 RepID=A0ACC3YBT0_COLTU|nr:uncharacterized protein CTRU02_15208 [Colletotrichum truncatum]KAF6781318.1 hypothetical protein CTRU02_15208 [Colletotrichum truncatum]
MAPYTDTANAALIWRSQFPNDEAYFRALADAKIRPDDQTCDPSLSRMYAEWLRLLADHPVLNADDLSSVADSQLPASLSDIPLDLVEDKMGKYSKQYGQYLASLQPSPASHKPTTAAAPSLWEDVYSGQHQEQQQEVMSLLNQRPGSVQSASLDGQQSRAPFISHVEQQPQVLISNGAVPPTMPASTTPMPRYMADLGRRANSPAAPLATPIVALSPVNYIKRQIDEARDAIEEQTRLFKKHEKTYADHARQASESQHQISLTVARLLEQNVQLAKLKTMLENKTKNPERGVVVDDDDDDDDKDDNDEVLQSWQPTPPTPNAVGGYPPSMGSSSSSAPRPLCL